MRVDRPRLLAGRPNGEELDELERQKLAGVVAGQLMMAAAPQ
jgi:hypothetical protein